MENVSRYRFERFAIPATRPALAFRDHPRSLERITFEALDVVDIVVSILKRFHANDRSDVSPMIDLELVSHSVHVERFVNAVDVFAGDVRAADLPRYVENLHEVERDMLGVDETFIELPDWYRPLQRRR
jgi:hypothetical protein